MDTQEQVIFRRIADALEVIGLALASKSYGDDSIDPKKQEVFAMLAREAKRRAEAFPKR